MNIPCWMSLFRGGEILCRIINLIQRKVRLVTSRNRAREIANQLYGQIISQFATEKSPDIERFVASAQQRINLYNEDKFPSL